MRNNCNILFQINNHIKSQKGMALMATLIFVFVLTTFGIALLTMTRNDIKLSVLQEESTVAFYLADAGVERAINWLTSQGTPPRAEDVPPVNLDGAHEFELDTGKYTVHLYVDPYQASTVAGYTIESEGWIPKDDGSKAKASRKIKTLVTITNFAEYAYFSDEELFPNNSNISGSGGYAGQVIWFTGNDEFGGKLHSNSQLHIVDVPIFNGKVTSTEETIDFWGNAYIADGSDFPGFMDQYELGVDYIPLPQYRDVSDLDNEKSLQRIAGGSKADIQGYIVNGVHIPNAGGTGTEATAGIYVKGNATIDLDVDSTAGSAGPNSQITITQGLNTTVVTSVKEPKTLPSGSTLNGNPSGGTIVPTNTTLVKTGTNIYESYNGLTNGLLFVDGAINGLSGNNHRGKMSIASTESITITDDIYYYDRDKNKDLFEEDVEALNDSLGLIAAKDVEIASGAPSDIEIDAIVMALNTSFFYEGWQNNLKGTLSLLGGLIQKQRGPVGTHNAGVKVTGYSKNYNFDPRMANPASGNLPPYFPTTGEYQKVWWKEE